MNTQENIRLWKTRLAQLSWFFHSFSSNAARAKAFEQMGLGNARTFYRCALMFRLTALYRLIGEMNPFTSTALSKFGEPSTP